MIDKKKIIIIVSSIILLIGVLSSGLYIKYQNNIKTYKQFCYNYQLISKKISLNLSAYFSHSSTVSIYLINHPNIYKTDNCFTSVIKDNKEYSDYIKQLNNLNIPKEFKDEYGELMDLYSNVNDDREKMNEEMIDNKKVDFNYKYTKDYEELINKQKEFDTKISDINKEKE